MCGYFCNNYHIERINPLIYVHVGSTYGGGQDISAGWHGKKTLTNRKKFCELQLDIVTLCEIFEKAKKKNNILYFSHYEPLYINSECKLSAPKLYLGHEKHIQFKERS